MTKKHLMWFRSDLRVTDNTALYAASQTSHQLMAVFCVCEKQWQQHHYGTARVDFMMRQLQDLKQALGKLKIPLLIVTVDYFNAIAHQLVQLCQQYQLDTVWCNQEYEVNEIQRDLHCQRLLHSIGVNFRAMHDQCILPPNTVHTQNGNMYKIFSPFFKKWQETLAVNPINCLPHPDMVSTLVVKAVSDGKFQLHHYHLDKLNPTIQQSFPAGEEYALKRLNHFICTTIDKYKTNRNLPSINGTSILSSYLAIGAISARQCYLLAKQRYRQATNDEQRTNIRQWISELCWRDFYRHIMVKYPTIVKGEAFDSKIDTNVPWQHNDTVFQQWCLGKTGIPIIDAAMRCLNTTGYMHNRLRMITAMFLTKNLLIDWRLGEQYFMQHLIDADFASNNGGWQWSASVGTDAVPYFRIMNPFTQAKTYDPEAVFIKTWLPELKTLPAKVIHHPEKLNEVAIAAGYVAAIVNVKSSRKMAIEVFKQAK